jgi:hypothetical protein
MIACDFGGRIYRVLHEAAAHRDNSLILLWIGRFAGQCHR